MMTAAAGPAAPRTECADGFSCRDSRCRLRAVERRRLSTALWYLLRHRRPRVPGRLLTDQHCSMQICEGSCVPACRTKELDCGLGQFCCVRISMTPVRRAAGVEEGTALTSQWLLCALRQQRRLYALQDRLVVHQYQTETATAWVNPVRWAARQGLRVALTSLSRTAAGSICTADVRLGSSTTMSRASRRRPHHRRWWDQRGRGNVKPPSTSCIRTSSSVLQHQRRLDPPHPGGCAYRKVRPCSAREPAEHAARPWRVTGELRWQCKPALVATLRLRLWLYEAMAAALWRRGPPPKRRDVAPQIPEVRPDAQQRCATSTPVQP